MLVVFPLVFYAVVGRGLTVFVRYVIPLVPFLCISAAVLTTAVSRRAAAWMRVPAAPVAIGAALLIAWPSIQRVIAFDRLIARPDTRLLAAAWLDARRQPLDWIHEAAPAVLHAKTGPHGVKFAEFDAERRVFVNDTGVTVIPTWIAIARSPLSVYTPDVPALREEVDRNYVVAESFTATQAPESPGWFDQQDMFFVPYAYFGARERSGPEIVIYRRR